MTRQARKLSGLGTYQGVWYRCPSTVAADGPLFWSNTIVVAYVKMIRRPLITLYLLKKGILYLTEARDNWYCERLKNECLFLYTQRSCTSAIEFITNYIPKDAIPIFDIYPFDFSSITETDDGDRDHGVL